jgi:hypothetical protein
VEVIDTAPLIASPDSRADPDGRPIVVTAQSHARNAASLLLSKLAPSGCATVLLFAAPETPLVDIATTIRAELGPDSLVFGCSSAGEFAFDGYQSGTVVAIGFPASTFRAQAMWLRNLSGLAVSDWMAGLRTQLAAFKSDATRARFGILLIDGLSQQEELVAATVDAALPGLSVIGGSSGDGLQFRRTCLVLNEQSYRDSAIFCLFEADFDVEEVIFDHFSPSSTRMVVTGAVPEERLILELNGERAAEEYALLIGVPLVDLNHRVFAEFPLLARIGGQNFVRAIREVTPEHGLKLMSSIENGMILTIGRAHDLIRGFETRLHKLKGRPLLILTFDCILRRLALEQAGLGSEIARIHGDYHIAGFNTYGEQHGGVHVNQTFVGLAILDQEAGDAARD